MIIANIVGCQLQAFMKKNQSLLVLLFLLFLWSPTFVNAYFVGPTRCIWANAKSYCEQYGTELASIHSFEDMVAANTICRANTPPILDVFYFCWIGLTDMDEEGFYKWIDNTATDYGFHNSDPTHLKNEGNYQFMLHDDGHGYDCFTIMSFMGEAYANLTYMGNDECWESWYPLCNDITDPIYQTKYNNLNGSDNFICAADDYMAYFAPDTSYSWSDAKSYCESQGTDLVSFHSELHKTSAQIICQKTLAQSGNQKGCWIGLNAINREDGSYEWSDGSTTDYIYNNASINISLWNEQCVYLNPFGVQINDLNCNYSLVPLCNTLCDESTMAKNGNDYRGCQSTSISGRQCQKWTEQSPWEHDITPEKYKHFGVGDHNYCRNPDHEGREDTIWCYTTSINEHMDPCEPLPCSVDFTQYIFDLADIIVHPGKSNNISCLTDIMIDDPLIISSDLDFNLVIEYMYVHESDEYNNYTNYTNNINCNVCNVA
eukprot:445599_1